VTVYQDGASWRWQYVNTRCNGSSQDRFPTRTAAEEAARVIAWCSDLPYFAPPAPPAAATPARRKALHATGTELYGRAWDATRHALVLAVTAGRTQSSTELTAHEAQRLIDGLRSHLAHRRSTMAVAA
jgi:hypothetical protein